MKIIGIDVRHCKTSGLDSRVFESSLNYLMANLSDAGYQVRLIDEINYNSLRDLDALIIGRITNDSVDFSEDEIKAIVEWFRQGGKLLWICADSQDSFTFNSDKANVILEAISSHFRFDHVIIGDLENYIDVNYMVIANRSVNGFNVNGTIGKIADDVNYVLFNRPVIIDGYKDGSYVRVEDVLGDHVYWICRTGPNGVIIDYYNIGSLAYPSGYVGRLYLAVAEEIPVTSDLFTIVYSKVIVTSGSLLGNLTIMSEKIDGLNLQGPTFVKNSFRWGLEIKAEPNVTGYIIVGVITIISVIGIAAHAARRKI